MNKPLQNIIDTFQAADDEFRLELLLDFCRKLPLLPQRLAAQRDAGSNRVHECMTPVFLWVELVEGRVHLHVGVAEEAPTIQGLLSIIVHAYDGATPGEVAQLPEDLLARLGLSRHIRMNRALGLAAIIRRIKHHASQVSEQPSLSESSG